MKWNDYVCCCDDPLCCFLCFQGNLCSSMDILEERGILEVSLTVQALVGYMSKHSVVWMNICDSHQLLRSTSISRTGLTHTHTLTGMSPHYKAQFGVPLLGALNTEANTNCCYTSASYICTSTSAFSEVYLPDDFDFDVLKTCVVIVQRFLQRLLQCNSFYNAVRTRKRVYCGYAGD